MLPLLKLMLLPLALAQNDPIVVCTLLENGFAQLQDGVASISDVTSDAQLRGFEVDMRENLLKGQAYRVRVLSGYGEVHVRTRAGECDVGWSNFFITAPRMTCEGCPEVPSELTTGVTDWEPYRCCTDFGVNVASVHPGSMAVLYKARSLSFYRAFLLTQPRFSSIWLLQGNALSPPAAA